YDTGARGVDGLEFRKGQGAEAEGARNRSSHIARRLFSQFSCTEVIRGQCRRHGQQLFLYTLRIDDWHYVGRLLEKNYRSRRNASWVRGGGHKIDGNNGMGEFQETADGTRRKALRRRGRVSKRVTRFVVAGVSFRSAGALVGAARATWPSLPDRNNRCPT